jgi:hypothetical protein
MQLQTQGLSGLPADPRLQLEVMIPETQNVHFRGTAYGYAVKSMPSR